MHCILKVRNGAFLIAISVLLFASCKRSSNVSPYFTSDDNGGYASDASRIELISNDVISMADAAGTYYNINYIAALGSGVNVTTDTLSIPHQININFGPTDVVCLDGKKRSGTITIFYSGEYTDSNQIHTINFTNYYINDNQLSGSVQVTRIDTTVAGNWYYRVKVAETLNMSQFSVNSQLITWDGSLVRKWVSGYLTGDRSDDVFSISGQAELTRANGNTYTFGIATPLQFALNCSYCESGLVDISGYSGYRVLNYGSGACDPNAQVTLLQDNSVYGITLTQ